MAKIRIVNDARTAGQAVTAIYIRVTSEESIKTDLSKPNQRIRAVEMCESRGWQAVKVYEELKHVAGDLGPERRPALAELLRDIEAGAVERVLVRHTDRLWRSTEVEDRILNVLHRNSVELWDFGGHKEFKTAGGRFALKVLGAAAELEKNLTGERIREMKRGKAKSGKLGGGPPSYGYASQSREYRERLNDGLAQGVAKERAEDDALKLACEKFPIAKTWYVDEAEAEVVRLIFHLYLEERLGARRISEELNRRGHRRRGGSKWSPVKVGKIINNPAMAGYTTYDEDAYQRGLPSKKARFRQTLFAGTHTAIISPETWHEAQRLKTDVNTKRVRTKGSPNARVYPLSGVLRCAVCGSAMTGKSSGNRENAYYICGRRNYYGPRDGCSGPTLLQHWAELTVWKYLDPLLSAPALMSELLERTRRRVRHDEPSLRAKLDALRAAASEIEVRQRRWLEKFEETKDDSSAEIVWNRIRELKSKHTSMLQEIEAAERQVTASAQPEVTEQEVMKLLARLANGDGSPEKRRILVQRLEQHHGLRVNMLDARRLALSLRIDAFAGSDITAQVGSRLVLVGNKPVDSHNRGRMRPMSSVLPKTADTRHPLGGPADPFEHVVTLEIQEPRAESESGWASRVNATTGAQNCACGCGGSIQAKDHHRASGLPKYLHGHHSNPIRRAYAELRTQGYVLLGEACKRLGISEGRYRRLEAAGTLPLVERVDVHGRSTRVMTGADIRRATRRLKSLDRK